MVADLTAGLRLSGHGEPQAAPHGPQDGLRTLVLGDDPQFTEGMASWVRHWGHQVRAAVDGRSALRADAADPPDVVLLAGAVSGTSPWDVARRLHGHPAEKRPFLIVLAGHAREVDPRRSGEAGVDLVLVKPVDLDLLRGVLSRFYRVIGPPETLAHDEADSRGAWEQQPALP
jgi:CheY-like chemotaxis protein